MAAVVVAADRRHCGTGQVVGQFPPFLWVCLKDEVEVVDGGDEAMWGDLGGAAEAEGAELRSPRRC